MISRVMGVVGGGGVTKTMCSFEITIDKAIEIITSTPPLHLQRRNIRRYYPRHRTAKPRGPEVGSTAPQVRLVSRLHISLRLGT